MAAAIPVIVNRSGGTAAARGDALRGELEAAFGAVGLAIDLHLVDGASVVDAVREARAAPIVVVGGGDGTLGGAADVIAGTDTALGILPLGTRNHLAGDLDIPADLTDAAKVIAAGNRRRIDLARVNDRAFVNNASVGLYPDMVERREAGQQRAGLPKWLAALPASIAALRRLRHHRMRLSWPGGGESVVTPMLFVGNNHYGLGRGEVGSRDALDDGKLSVYAVASRRRLALIGFAMRAMVGGADMARDFAAIGDVAELDVEGSSRDIRIALDGEVTHLAMPLRFRIEPRALSVVAPLEGEAATA